MKHLLLPFLLFIYSPSFAQDKLTVTPYLSVNGLLPGSEMAKTSLITDGHITRVFGSNLGVNTQFFKGIGFFAEISAHHYTTTDFYVNYYDVVSTEYETLYPITGVGGSGKSSYGLDYGGILSTRFGPSYTLDLDRSEIYLGLFYGRILNWGRGDQDSIQNIVFRYAYETNNDFNGQRYVTANSGYMAGLDLRYQFNFSESRRFGLFAGFEFNFGRINYLYREIITDPNFPSLDKDVTENSGLDYIQYGWRFGLAIDMIKKE